MTIQDIIHYKRNNTLLSHVKTFLECDKENYSGIVVDNTFAAWKYNAIGGPFYPVIYGKMNSDKGEVRITTTKQNPFGFLLSVCILLLFFVALASRNTSLENYSLSLFITLFPLLAIVLSYRHHRKQVLAEFEELLKKKTADSLISNNQRICG